ncbi:MAG: PH domain-containing protein [Lachnospirales bacterium]
MIDFTNKTLFKLKKSNIAVPDVINKLLIPNEDVIGIYTALRDYVIFTNKRIIAVNVQGITGKEGFTSLPYSKIQLFSVETAGVIDLDSELGNLSLAELAKLSLIYRCQ